MLRRSRTLVPLLLLAMSFGCSRCGARRPAQPGLLSLVPQDATAVLVAPDLGRLADDLSRLQAMKLSTFAAQLKGFPDAAAFGGALVAQLGVDLRSRPALEAAGVGLDKGAALVLTEGGEFLVVGAKDAQKLVATLTGLARRRLGAEARTATEHGVTLTTFARGGGPALFAIASSGDFVLLGAGAQTARLAGEATLPAERTLGATPLVQQALAKLPAARDLWAYFPRPARFWGVELPASTALCASLGKHALELHAAVPLPAVTPLAEALKKQGGTDLTAQIPADAVLAATFNVDPKSWVTIWPRLLDARLTRLVTETGIDVDRELLGNLGPGGFVSLALAPTAQLGQGLPSLDVRRANPFHFVQLTAAMPVRDGAAADRTLAGLAKSAPRFGATMSKGTVASEPAFLTSYAQGEGADLARIGEEVLVGAPQARLAQAIAQAKKPGTPGFDGPLEEALRQPAIGAVLDLHRLADEVRALPSSAWGVGGFAMKATAVRWLEATGELEAVTLGVHAEGGTGLVDLAVRLDLESPAAPGTP